MNANAAMFSADAESVLRYLARTKREIERTRHALIEPCQLGNAERAGAALKELLAGGWIDATGLGESYILTAKGKDAAKHLAQNPKTLILTNVSNVEKGGHVVVNAPTDAVALPSLSSNSHGFEDETVKSQPALGSGIKDTHDGLIPVKSASLAPMPPTRPRVQEVDIDLESETMRTLHIDGLPRARTHMLRMHEALMPESGRGALLAPIHFLLAFEAYPDVLPVPIFNGDILGRARSAHVRLLHDMLISKLHCRFSLTRSGNGMALTIEDLGSMNGTIVDGKMLHKGETAKLKHGSRFTVARTTLIVVTVPVGKGI